MPRFAANVTMLFTEVPMLARPDLAREAGFDGIEVLFPYDHPPKDWQAALAGMPVALINTHPGDWAAGDRGHAAVPGATDAFRASFSRAAGPRATPAMTWMRPAPSCAARSAAQVPDLHLTIEPLNPDDMPGYFLNDFDQAARIVDDLALPNLGIQFDLWHAARIHGDADAVWARHKTRVNHIQIAGFPSRNEPGGGGFDLTGLCAELDRTDYPGWISAEYLPARATVHGLMWLAALKGRARLIGA